MKYSMPSLLCLLLTGAYSCTIQQEPISTQVPRNNNTYEVEYLFEHEGCKVYRFVDGGQRVYFTNCRGETVAVTDSTQIRNSTNLKRKN